MVEYSSVYSNTFSITPSGEGRSKISEVRILRRGNKV